MNNFEISGHQTDHGYILDFSHSLANKKGALHYTITH